MEIKIVKINSPEEFFEFLESLGKEECSECKRDLEKGKAEAEARYDKFIDLTLDLVKCCAEDGNFNRDCELYRAHLHEAPFNAKRAFYRNFASMVKEAIDDILELVAEHAWMYSNKKSSNDKEQPKKSKDTQTKKEK